MLQKIVVLIYDFNFAIYMSAKESREKKYGDLCEEINSLIDLRNKARASKDYKEADRIRDELFDKGVLIEDKDGKTLWKFK